MNALAFAASLDVFIEDTVEPSSPRHCGVALDGSADICVGGGPDPCPAPLRDCMPSVFSWRCHGVQVVLLIFSRVSQ